MLVQSRSLTEQPTAVRRAVLAVDQLAEWVPVACSQVAGYLFRRHIAPAGFAFARYHRLAAGLIGVEAGVPVSTPVRPASLIAASTLPGGAALSVRYTGPYDRIGLAYEEISDWLATEQALRAGDGWEIYRDLPSCDRLGRRIEIVQPIVFAHSAV
ncbi:GyrI-like domain-containing protein [Kribbella sp. NPDC020789]